MCTVNSYNIGNLVSGIYHHNGAPGHLAQLLQKFLTEHSNP